MDEKRLVEAILANDRKAFQEFVCRYEKLVKHIAYTLLRESTDREDEVQEIFVKLYTRLKSFRHESKLSTWIACIAYNHCLNVCRRKRISILVITNDIEIQLSDDYSATVNLEAELLKAINCLPADHQLIIRMFHLDEMSYEEIGKVLQLPEGTIKSRLFRAREMLRSKMTKIKFEDE